MGFSCACHIATMTPLHAAKDSPEGYEILVQRIKNHSSACQTCFYVQRGSFTGLKQLELINGMKEHHLVKEKPLFCTSDDNQNQMRCVSMSAGGYSTSNFFTRPG